MRYVPTEDDDDDNGNNESELMFGYINYTCRSQEVFKEMCDRFIGTV